MTRSARRTRRSRRSSVFILIVSIFLLIMAAAYLAVGVYYKDRFFPGSYINGEDCSGMTVDEVEKRIADSVTDYQITIAERGGKEEVIDGSAIDFSYVSTGAVQELQEEQNSFNWMYAFFHPLLSGLSCMLLQAYADNPKIRTVSLFLFTWKARMHAWCSGGKHPLRYPLTCLHTERPALPVLCRPES